MRVPLVLALAVLLGAVFTEQTVAESEPGGVSYRNSGATHPPLVARHTPTVQPQAIIGADEREPVLNASEYPWRTISYLELYVAGEKSGSCTGTFVGPDVLLTVAHCLWSEEDGFKSDIAVVPAKDGASEPYGFEFAFDWVVPQGWIDSGGTDTVWDFGLIIMDDQTLGSTVGWLSIASMTTATLSRSDFTPAIVGYPGDIGSGDTMWGTAKDAFFGVQDLILEYEIDTAPGQSGSAIISLNTTAFFLGYVVGIHTTGGIVANHGTRIDAELLDFFDDLCFDAGCEIELFEETTGGGSIWADADCDGSLTTRDNQSILRIVLQQNPLSQTLPCSAIGTGVSIEGFGTIGWADADCDGLITSRDNQALMRSVLQQNPLGQTEPCPDVGTPVVVSDGTIPSTPTTTPTSTSASPTATATPTPIPTATQFPTSTPGPTPSTILALVAEDGQFLGELSCDKFASDGIFNRFGDYGSKFSSDSIWNKFGKYGGKFGTYSPFNKFGTPPRAEDDLYWYYYVTEEALYSPSRKPTDIVWECFGNNSSERDFWLEIIADST